MLKQVKTGLMLSILMFSIAVQSTKAMTVTESGPFFTVRMESRAIGCELLINDIPVLSNEYPGIISRFPINSWLMNGLNTYKLRPLPVDSATRAHPEFSVADMFCKVVILLSQGIGLPDTIFVQAEIAPNVADSMVAKDGCFNVTPGYPDPAWAHSGKIGKDCLTQRKILDKFREFHRLLENKDLDGIMAFSSAKFKEYSRAMLNPDFESVMKKSYSEQFAGKDELIGIEVQQADGLKYEYYCGDRLVTIMNVEDRSIIQYYNDDEGSTSEYPLLFYFDGTDFVLIL